MFNSLYGGFISPLLVFLYWVLVLAVSLRIIFKRKPTSFVVAWLFVIHLLPVIGLFLYFALGEVHLGQLRGKRAKDLQPELENYLIQLTQHNAIVSKESSPIAKRLFQLYKYQLHQLHMGGIIGHEIKLIDNAKAVFESLINDINQATQTIEMTFYIWQTGGDADNVQQAFMKAAKRGVTCRLILDSAGSRQFIKKSDDIKKMQAAGIEIVECLKVNIFRFMFRRLDLRQHRKMIMIDNLISYTGSMNLVDPRFFGQDKNVGEWVDMMIRMKGPITSIMSIIFASDWLMETDKFLKLPEPPHYPDYDENHHHIVQLVPSGPAYTENVLHQCLLTAIYCAEKEITFTTPYFVPSDDLLYAMCTAAQRGVIVKIILPEKCDSLMANWAGRAFYTELLNSGVEIWYFQHNLLHSKSVLIDGQLSLVGTVNLDMRSLWLNFELTTIIDDAPFANTLKQLLLQYETQSKQLMLDEWNRRPLWYRAVERLFYFFSPLL